MQCPYCGGEMIEGRLMASRQDSLYWLPDGEDSLIFVTKRRVEKCSGVWLCGSTELVSAWRCPECKKLILPYE